MNMKVLAPEIGALHMGPQKPNADFLENKSSDFYYISVISGYHLPKQNCIRGIFRKTMVRHL
jgi:hypothetical protein